MNQSVTVRRAGPADAATVHTLVTEIAAHEGDAEHVTATADRWVELLGRDDVIVLLAERSGEPLGYVSALRRLHLWSGGDILALDDLWVRATARDAGVGRTLMLALARTVAADGLVIRWEVKPRNEAAQRFYRRLGANLRTKVVAGWPAERYRGLLTPEVATPA